MDSEVRFTVKELIQRQDLKIDRLEEQIRTLEKTGSMSAQQAVHDIAAIKDEVAQLENFKSDLTGRMTATAVGIGVLFTVVQIALHFWKV